MVFTMVCAVALMLLSAFGRGVALPEMLGLPYTWQDAGFCVGVAIWLLAYFGRILRMLSFDVTGGNGAYLGPRYRSGRPDPTVSGALLHVMFREGGFGCALTTTFIWGVLWVFWLASNADPRLSFLPQVVFGGLPVLAFLIGTFRAARAAEREVRGDARAVRAAAGTSSGKGAGAQARSGSGAGLASAGAALATAGVAYAISEDYANNAVSAASAPGSVVPGFESDSGVFSSPAVNIDGTPMVGSVDIHGNPYGVTQIESPQYEPPQFDSYQPSTYDTGSSGSFGGGWND